MGKVYVCNTTTTVAKFYISPYFNREEFVLIQQPYLRLIETTDIKDIFFIGAPQTSRIPNAASFPTPSPAYTSHILPNGILDSNVRVHTDKRQNHDRIKTPPTSTLLSFLPCNLYGDPSTPYDQIPAHARTHALKGFVLFFHGMNIYT